MSSSQKRRRTSGPPSVTVEIDLSDDEPGQRPLEVPKRRRGRPRAAPRSIEFQVQRAPTPPANAHTGDSNRRHVAVPNPGAPTPLPEQCPDGEPLMFDDGPTNADLEPENETGTGRVPNMTPNQNLKEWIEFYMNGYLDTLYSRDSPPTSLPCESCGDPHNDSHRCTSCLGAGILCTTCIKSVHRHNPTHRIKSWDGSSWVDARLSDLGYVFYLGHGGNPCPVVKEPSKLYIGDRNGFTHTRVQYCDCKDALSKPRQLLQAGLFPCSHLHPKSALTFPLLDMYDTLSTRARTSAYKYYSALEQLTKPGFSADVDDRYRELMWTHRMFVHLLQLRRAGSMFPVHPDIDVHPGDQTVDCVACPCPGFNFEWDELTPEERVWFRFWLSFDGNSRSVRKNKRVDPDDISLSDGLGYFPPKQAYREWTETAKTTKRWDKPSCDNHKAGLQLSARWVGLDVTGVGAFSCTRHTCILPRGMVDFFQGELFIYSVYALGALLCFINKRRGGSIPIGITYDVMCHWIVNFYTRAKLLPASISIPEFLDLICAIPKWHLVGHERECWIRWALDHILYVGRIDGEAPERFWSHMNQHSGSTSEQSPGARTDTMNNIIRHWNEDKAFSMNKFVPTQYKKSKRMFIQQKEVFDQLTRSLKPADIERWEREPVEPVKGPNGKWVSPFMDPVFDGGFYETMKGERQKEAPTARVAGRRPGAARWLSDGIEIEHSIRKFNVEANELGSTPTPGRAKSLNAKRVTLRNRVDAHRKKRELEMAGVEEPDKPRTLGFFEEDDESVNLAMPSSYAPETINSAGLDTLAEVERELRRVMCKESIQSVKRLLTAKKVTQLDKAREVRGQVPNTRANTVLKDYDAKIHDTQWRYSNSRAALVQLGFSESDSAFLELTNEDLKPLATYFMEYASGTAHGRAAVSWIWRTSVALNTHDMSDWEVIAWKTEWFRSRERCKRWEEDLIILKREAIMTMRSFKKLQELWEWRSASLDITPGMAAYARGRAKFFAQHATRMLISCQKELYDTTVELKWADAWLRDNVIVDGVSVKFVNA